MKVFITGGTGFIGGHVLRKLVARGDEVAALARSEHSAAAVKAMGAHAVIGDLHDMDALREGMQGCDVVFHIAAWYKLGANDPEKMAHINFEGTLNVLKTAHEVGVPKIIYTSSLAVFGDTHGQLVDEGFFQGAPFLTDYDRTKWLAHYKAALPLIAQGAPIIIVQPGAVYGPGDHSLVGETLTWFCRGWLPVLPGPETMLTYAHVEDIAEGHLLAADKGVPGESYILAGPALTLNEFIAVASEITGKRAPLFSIPAKLLVSFAPLIGKIEQVVPLPALFSRDSIAILGSTYIARADKAHKKLGWRTRPIHEGLQETLASIAESLPSEAEMKQRKQMAGIALLIAAMGLLWWGIKKRRK